MTVDFAFFHVGEDFTLPKMLCESIRITNPNSNIIQLTDKRTPILSELVTKYLRVDGNKDELMFLRSKAYQSYNIHKPTLFLDTDMLVIKEFDENKIFNDKSYIFLERFYDGLINPEYLKKHKLEQYIGKTWKQFCPYLGCFIGAKDQIILKEIHKNYIKLDQYFRKWNGDQMALHETFKKFNRIGLVTEKYYANPIKEDVNLDDIFILHFKGIKKDMMKPYFDRIFNNGK